MNEYDICIIGAGQSGITTCKTFSETNKKIIVLEKCNNCEGMFSNIKEKDYFRWSSSRYVSGFSDFPMDKSLGTWFTIQNYIDYLNNYKKHFKLDKYIQYGANVEKCNQNNEENWIVNYKINNINYKLISKKLIVCTGLNNYKKFPNIVDNFKGPIYHTQDIYYMDKYQWKEKFYGKKILLIGGAESAFDIGHVLVNNNSDLYYTTKNYIEWYPAGNDTVKNIKRAKKINNPQFKSLKKFFEEDEKSESTDLNLNYVEYSLPEPMSAVWHEYGRYIIGYLFFSLLLGDSNFMNNKCVHSHQQLCSINETPNNLFKKYVVKRTEFLLDLYEEKVKIIKFPNKIHGKTVEYVNGSIKDVDIIVCATGYKKNFPFLDKKYTEGEFIKKMIPKNTHNLAFIGFARPTMGSIAAIAEMQSWWVNEYFYNNLNYQIRKPFFRNIDPLNLENEHINSLVIGCYYLKDLAKDMNLEPNLLYLFFTNYDLFTTILSNSCHPMMYRIHGKKRTPESEKILLDTWPTFKNKIFWSKLYILFFVFLHIIYYLIILLIFYLIYSYRNRILKLYKKYKKLSNRFIKNKLIYINKIYNII